MKINGVEVIDGESISIKLADLPEFNQHINEVLTSMDNLIYAGIGSRETPLPILSNMTAIAKTLSGLGWKLRSGGAIGADSAFQHGAQGRQEIFRPQDATPAAMEMASAYHPNWAACSPYVRKLHGRNSQILFGRDLRQPVRCVVCWTQGGTATGGTGQALRIAEDLDIPIINLWELDFKFEEASIMRRITA